MYFCSSPKPHVSREPCFLSLEQGVRNQDAGAERMHPHGLLLLCFLHGQPLFPSIPLPCWNNSPLSSKLSTVPPSPGKFLQLPSKVEFNSALLSPVPFLHCIALKFTCLTPPLAELFLGKDCVFCFQERIRIRTAFH